MEGKWKKISLPEHEEQEQVLGGLFSLLKIYTRTSVSFFRWFVHLYLALRGVQLPVPVLQWSDWTERTYIKKNCLRFFLGFLLLFQWIARFYLAQGGVQLPLPVLQWSDWTERILIKKKAAKDLSWPFDCFSRWYDQLYLALRGVQIPPPGPAMVQQTGRSSIKKNRRYNTKLDSIGDKRQLKGNKDCCRSCYACDFFPSVAKRNSDGHKKPACADRRAISAAAAA